MEAVDNQIVIVDPREFGEDSIELVAADISAENERSYDAEKKDIRETEAIPMNTRGKLYFSDQEGLDVSRNKVQSRPKIDEKIKGHMTTLEEILQTPEFGTFHNTGKEVNERLLSAIEYASKNSTSLNAVNDLLGSCFAVLLEACHGVADKFVLSDDVVTALADFKRCERERYDLLKKTEMDSAEEKRKAGEDLLDIAISRGEHDVKRVLDRQTRMEEAQTLQKFINKRQELDEDINREIEDLNMMTENCEVDIGTIGKNLDTLRQSAEITCKKYKEKDNILCKELRENKAEQDKLQQRLNELKDQERQLDEERNQRKKIQETAELTEQKARDELEKWQQQIQDLHDKCQAALYVLLEFKDGSSKLMEASIESKRKEEKELHEKDIAAHRRLRDATAAAAVESKQCIEDCQNNLKYLKKQITDLKEEKKQKARSGLKVIVAEIVEKLKKYEDFYSHDKQKKANNEQKFEVYKKKMEELDDRLTQLGEVTEAFDDIYHRVQEEVNALWEGEGFSSLED
ncbi:uncharacterized protein [Porites lutea]|uniref:uncharacterized protein n=1 Tax=Porites lutea TaxID=51062 RepID=UPI003CC6ADF1